MRNIYLNLATNSLRKNKNFYLPYIASSVVMFALFYTLSQIENDPFMRTIHGGKTLVTILGIGLPVIALLSALFIIYMSSFIMKRRKKELGLYGVLGMEKRHIIRVVIIENIIVSTITLVSGTIVGVLVEKLAQLLLFKILKQEVTFEFSISPTVILKSVTLFAAIFFVIILNSIREILFKPLLNYIKEEQVGEKKPKARWFLGFLGLGILVYAYYIASTVTNGAAALTRFFYAVLLVIVATYLLFIVGSIVALTIMKKNRNYYYKTTHFISVSGMIYRMKRNGAGLASICILCTMVLVMMSSVSTVFFYNGKQFNDKFIYDFGITADDEKKVMLDVSNEEGEWNERVPYDFSEIENQIYEVAKEAEVEVTDLVRYKTFGFYSSFDGTSIYPIPNYMDKYYEIWTLSNSDYKKINNTDLELNDNQIAWFSMSGETKIDGQIKFVGNRTFESVKAPSRPLIMPGEFTSTCSDILFLVLPDSYELGTMVDELKEFWNANGGKEFYALRSNANYTFFDFNIAGGRENELKFFEKYNSIILEPIPVDLLEENNTNSGNYDGVYRVIFSTELFEQLFYNMYGGLFFLGILLSIACIVIAVLIMYFKQLLEGYEDAKRFAIMKKVGLTTEEIKKSIYSQIVMVFITPLLSAGLHTAFAYKMVSSLIKLFGISSIDGYFVILTICMVAFMIFYGIVFWITSKKYLKIVNAAENAV